MEDAYGEPTLRPEISGRPGMNETQVDVIAGTNDARWGWGKWRVAAAIPSDCRWGTLTRDHQHASGST